MKRSGMVALVCTTFFATIAQAQAPTFLTEQTSSDVRTTRLVGLNVLGPDDKKIGDVNDIVLDSSGAAKAAVIGVGGFLGIGEKNVAVPFSALTWVMAPTGMAGVPVQTPGSHVPNAAVPSSSPVTPSTPTAAVPIASTPAVGPDHAVLRMTKEELEKAPSYRFSGERTGTMTVPAASGTGTMTTVPTSPTNPTAPVTRP